MNYLSLFSGIEAASQAWRCLGWNCKAVSEIETFPCEILAHHYPETPNLGDITKITSNQVEDLGDIDLVAYGFPCQDLSVAGKRKGLRNETNGNATRSGLFYEAVKIIDWTEARWSVAENVPGLLSSNKGLDFAAVVSELCGREIPIPNGKWQNAGVALGPKGLVEWGILDTQYCRTPRFPRAIPQRRRRIFIVRDTGDWSSREPIFLDSESLRGNSPPSRETGEEIAGESAACLRSGGSGNVPSSRGEYLVASYTPSSLGNYKEGTGTLRANGGDSGGGSEVLSVFNKQRQGEYSAENVASTCAARDYKDATDLVVTGIDEEQNATEEFFGTLKARQQGGGFEGVVAIQTANTNANGKNWSDKGSSYTLDQASPPAVAYATQVRRLTVEECEALQGFPRGYTRISWKGKPADQCPDGPRYKALGNSMSVNVMEWIGRRIEEVNTKKTK